MDVKKMTAPCGLACWACAYYKDNITDELAQQVAANRDRGPGYVL